MTVLSKNSKYPHSSIVQKRHCRVKTLSFLKGTIDFYLSVLNIYFLSKIN